MRPKRIAVAAIVILAMSAVWFGTGPSLRGKRQEGIYVPAAASLASALESLAEDFEESRGIRVRLDLASSGVLRMKMEAGARVDAFVSASVRDMDLLERSGYVMSGTRRNLLRNTLVCVVGASSGLDVAGPTDLLNGEIRRIAIGDPAYVPSGLYAKQALTHLGLWERLGDKLVPCVDASAAMALVKAGAVEAAIVYGSDAGTSAVVQKAFGFPPTSHATIVYPVCVLKDAPRPAAARAFLEYLRSPHAAKVFAANGFEPIRQEVE